METQSSPSSSGGSSESLSSSGSEEGASPSTTRKRPRTEDHVTNRSSIRSKPFLIEWPEEGSKLTAVITFLKNTKKSSSDSCTWKEDKICLLGRAQIHCVEGSITILGHGLDPSKSKIQIESPSWSSLLVLEPKQQLRSSIEEDSKLAVVRVESWWPQSSSQRQDAAEATFELIEAGSPRVRPTFIPSSWENAVNQALPDANKSLRMTICGGQGVGKSTFLRYATNRLLSDGGFDKVAILDADVGQPEMSPPGMVSLTFVANPILTPPHHRSLTNNSGGQLSPQQHCFFFGAVTSKTNPPRYLQMIQQLIQRFQQQQQEQEEIPLLINLDGWVKGLGFELLCTLLTEILDPSHVVQIVGTTKSKQFELRQVLNPQVSRARLHVVHSYNSSLNLAANSSSDDNPTTTPIRCVIPSNALRALRLCTYFLQDVTIWYKLGFDHEGIRDDTCEIAHRLAGALPYAVPFEAVEVDCEGSDHFSDLHDNFDLLLDAINAKIVGLCCRDDDQSSTSTTPEGDGDDLVSCVGLGLVRAIDRAQKLYYILTPVDPEKLVKVNVLMAGMIEVPMEFWFRGVHAEAFPYQTFAPSSTTVGVEPMKSRNNIGRKGLTNGTTAATT